MPKSDVLQIVPLDMRWPTPNPFLFCVYHRDAYPEGNDKMEPDPAMLKGREMGSDFDPANDWRMYHGRTLPGFPVHPHRGFETITVVREGLVDHFDSMGATGRYGEGDTQWMTAGKGVQHSEMFPLVHADKPNTLVLFQIWINLPSARKFADPHFVMLWAENTPRETFTDSAGQTTQVEIIAGALNGVQANSPPPASWAAQPENEVAVWVIDMQANAEWTLPPASAGINRVLYFYEGSDLEVGDTQLGVMNAAVLQPDSSVKLKAGEKPVRLLMLQGRPINEPVAQYGPFVMSNQAEIQQAYRDYQATQFGGWSWSKADPVHPRSQGRFARFADGSEQTPGSSDD